MDGVLVIDKPEGMTSHDVVAVARRALGERRIGHTGTLDPMATGVLPLACGKATRLVRFLTGADKAYRATIRFGLTTDTYDITGTPVDRSGAVPAPDALATAVADAVGPHLQMPPAYSAKKVGGQRAYDLARRQQTVTLTPAQVTLHAATLVSYRDGEAVIDLTCSAGYYVRSLAHDLGQGLGTGACLAALRRTRSGPFDETMALPLDQLREDPAAAASHLVHMDHLLEDLPALRLTEADGRRVAHGQSVAPAGGPAGLPAPAAPPWTRLLDANGHLIALAQPGDAPGVLHPVVVLI